MPTIEEGTLVRHKKDGWTDRVQRRQQATSRAGHRLSVVIVRGTVYLPEEFAVVEEDDGQLQPLPRAR
jgi:hypothetical protein